MPAHGPQQRLYGHRVVIDVPAVDLQEQLRRNGRDYNAVVAHHRGDVVFESNLLRCVHCHAGHAVTSRVQLTDEQTSPVRWCSSCQDWRCARNPACAECSRSSNHRERKLEIAELASKRGRLLDEIRLVGLPFHGHAIQARGRVLVAVPEAPRPAGALVIAAP